MRRRTQPASTRRWVSAERHSLASISNILSNLTDIEQGILLRRWVGRNYFTALTLAYKLAWRLLDLPKWEECVGQDRIEADKKSQRVVFHFDKLSQKDPITIERPQKNAQNDPVYRLALIMRTLSAAGDSAHNSAVREECQAWIEDFVPTIQQTLQKLAQETIAWRIEVGSLSSDQETPEPPDNLDTLAQRLEFVLSVMMLDRNIRIVFYEWSHCVMRNLTGGYDSCAFSFSPRPSDVLELLSNGLSARASVLGETHHSVLLAHDASNSFSALLAHFSSYPPASYPLMGPLLHRWPVSSSLCDASCLPLVAAGSWLLPKMTPSDAACFFVERVAVQMDASR